jgi:hypothetical protein
MPGMANEEKPEEAGAPEERAPGHRTGDRTGLRRRPLLLTYDLVQELQQHAYAGNEPPSEIVRRAIHEYFERRGVNLKKERM